MKTIQEKITFAFAALLYLLFHLRGGADAGAMLVGTVAQLLTTLPYCLGFTFIAVRVIQYLHQGQQLPWDRIIRIFFTIGIFFGFFFALYEYAEQGQGQAQQTQSSSLLKAAPTPVLRQGAPDYVPALCSGSQRKISVQPVCAKSSSAMS
jgi:hypothetical protein